MNFISFNVIRLSWIIAILSFDFLSLDVGDMQILDKKCKNNRVDLMIIKEKGN